MVIAQVLVHIITHHRVTQALYLTQKDPKDNLMPILTTGLHLKLDSKTRRTSQMYSQDSEMSIKAKVCSTFFRQKEANMTQNNISKNNQKKSFLVKIKLGLENFVLCLIRIRFKIKNLYGNASQINHHKV